MTRQISANTEAHAVADLTETGWLIVARQRPMALDAEWHWTLSPPDAVTFRNMVKVGRATTVQRRTGDVVELLGKLVTPKVR